MTRITQRDAIATAYGWDGGDVEEYQPTRRVHSRTFLYQNGSGYVVAVKAGAPVPRAYAEYAPWVMRDSWRGWDVYESAAETR